LVIVPVLVGLWNYYISVVRDLMFTRKASWRGSAVFPSPYIMR